MDKSILIVENDQKVSNLLARKLRETGLIAEIASTGQQALEFIGQNQFQCAIVSFNLDQGAGLAIAEKIKQAQVPVIMLFSFEQPRIVAQAAAFGVNDIFFKTDFDVSQVIKKVFQKIKK